MIDRRYLRGRQQGHGFLYQRAELSLGSRILIQQVREPARPPLGLGHPDRLQLTTRRLGQQFVRLRQPMFRGPDLPDIPMAQQTRETAPDQFPHVRDRRSRHRLTSPLRKRN